MVTRTALSWGVMRNEYLGLCLLGDEELEVGINGRKLNLQIYNESYSSQNFIELSPNPFIRGLCRQSHLHSCKEGNYKFPNLFLEKKKKYEGRHLSLGILCEGRVVLGFANTEDFSVFLCRFLTLMLII